MIRDDSHSERLLIGGPDVQTPDTQEIARDLNEHIELGITDLVLDLRHVAFAGSEFISLLIGASRRLGYRHGRLRLSHVQPQLLRVLHTLGLGDFFETVPDCPERATA